MISLPSIYSELRAIPWPPGAAPPGGFDCGHSDLNDYLHDGDAFRDVEARVSVAYQVLYQQQVIGYFSVLTDAIRLDRKERPKGVTYGSAPALKLGRMGVDRPFKKQDVGPWILDFVIGMARQLAATAGCRYVTLDALAAPKLITWYEKQGFIRNVREKAVRKFVRQQFAKIKIDVPEHNVSMRYDIFLTGDLPSTGSDTTVTPGRTAAGLPG